jgi:predicted phosphodiesterase
MKLGLITDIHEHAANLRAALGRLEHENVDEIILLGDIAESGLALDDTCGLLCDAGIRGVWGNHDFGLCVDPTPDMQQKFAASTLSYFARLHPTLAIEDCHFSHVEPWLDPTSLFDLWYYDGPPDQHQKLWRIFAALPHRILFAGHFHKWLVATPDEILPWNGERPITLAPGRFFCVIGALCDGHFATFDTVTSELRPLNVVRQPAPQVTIGAPLKPAIECDPV